ncbi:MAG: hypothetical protein JWM11_4288 [Planctomycetaceae bacterium]|nr:hypothetical protein [Planctomycetaceae bacterium]
MKLPCLALACWLLAGFVVVAHADDLVQPIQIRILDARTKQLVAARVYIQHSDGRWFFPKSKSPDGTAIPYQRQRPEKIEEMHSTVSADPFEAQLPVGRYTITVERGKEYLTKSVSFEIPAKGNVANLDVEISRWIHMAELGWFSGDTHLHRELSEMPNLVLAEDLNVCFPLSHWITSADVDPVSGNRIKSGPDKSAAVHPEVISVDPTHLIYPLNTEYEIFTVGGKSHTLGAFVVIGHKTPFNIKVPSVKPAAEWAHREGGLIDLEKHSWPWSLAIVPIMQVDLFELANNHCWRTEFAFRQWTIDAAGDYMRLEKETAGLTEWGWIDFGFQTYYALLNCGFRLQPTAGTGSGVHPVPVGFGRVYVQVDGGFTYEKWFQGLRSGRSFVTTGPMLFTTVNEQPPGHVFQNAKPGTPYRVQGHIESTHRVSLVEIVVNGEVVKTIEPKSVANPTTSLKSTFDETVSVPGSGWIAVRCFEDLPRKRARFAHSSPVHIEVKDQPVAPRRAEIDYIIRRVKEEIARNKSLLSPEAVAEFEKSLKIYEEIAKRAR